MGSSVNKINEASSFKSFLNQIQHPIAIHTAGKFVFVNNAGLKLFKATAQKAILGKEVLDFVHPDNKGSSIIRIKEIYEGKIVSPIEQKLVNLQGEYIFAILSSTLITYNAKPSILVSAKDITEQRTFKEGISYNEIAYRNFVENLDEGIIRFFIDERIQFVNKRFCQIVGYKKEELIGKVGHNFLIDKSYLPIINGLIKKRRAGKSSNYEIQLIRKDGQRIWASVSGTPLFNENKKFIGTINMITDISERKKNEKLLKHREVQFRGLFENAHDLIQSVKKDGKFEYVNKAWLKTLGYKSKEVNDLIIWDIIHPESVEHCMAMFGKVMEGKTIKNIEAAFISKGGQKISVIGNVTTRKEGSKIFATQGIFHNVTEKNITDQNLMESEANLKQAQEIGHLGSYEWNLITNKIHWNEQMYEIYGVNKKVTPTLEMAASLTHPEDIKEMENVIKASIDGDVRQSYEYRILRKDKQLRYAIARSKLFVDKNDKPIKIIGTIQDITEQKEAEFKIRELNESLEKRVIDRTEQLEKANNEIKSLLQEMHHRVKNNLQIVTSLLNIEANSVDNEYIYEAFKESHDRIQTMAFIHESLYLNKSMSEISVRKYLKQLVKDRIKANANKENQIELQGNFPNISFKIEKMLPIGLLLNELLTNSLKHAFPNRKAGVINVSLEQKGKDYLLIYKDNGIGFTEKKRASNPKSVGLILIDSFIMQFEGKMKKINAPGTHYEISFNAD